MCETSACFVGTWGILALIAKVLWTLILAGLVLIVFRIFNILGSFKNMVERMDYASDWKNWGTILKGMFGFGKRK